MAHTTVTDPVSRVRDITPVLRRTAPASEAARALSPEAHAALVSAGVFDLSRPLSLGGQEVDLLTLVRTVKEVARADGSAGWCAMISGVYATFGGLLPRAGAEEVFANGTTVIAGALGPMGQAARVPGGYRVSGRWTFGSNSAHADWFVGGAVVVEADGPVLLPNGMPRITLVLVPRVDVTVIDTWKSTGLCGTASHDYAIKDIFVPDERTFWFSDVPQEPGPLYALPMVAAYGTVIAAVPLGIAERVLELYADLAPLKKPILSPLTLQQKANVHDRVGVALATVQAATAYLERVVSDAWACVAAGQRLDWTQRGKLWLGATHAAQMSMQAIEQLYTIAGGTAVYSVSEFDRCLRDARTAVQHVMTQFVNYEIAGKQFVGLEIRDSLWSFDDRGDAWQRGGATNAGATAGQESTR